MERAQVSLLAQARYDKGWSQERLAERMEVTAVTVSRWEQGQSVPHPRHLVQLCKLFSKQPLELGFDVSVVMQSVPEPIPKVEGNVEGSSGEIAVLQNAEVSSDAVEKGTYAAWRSQMFYARLMNIIWNWPRTARYHELQALITLEYEDNMTAENLMDRRNTLLLLVSFTVEACSSTALRNLFNVAPEEILTQSAAGITACWHLHKGKDLALVSDAISKYIPPLEEIMRSTPEGQRKTAADQLAQCYLLKASLAKHVTNNDAAIRYAKLAEEYSVVARNPMLHILAVRRLAAAQSYMNSWEQALESAEKARYLLEKTKTPMPLLLHSYVHAGLATYGAYNGEKQSALTALGKAHTTFFAQSDEDEVPIWIDHSKANLVLNDALTHMHLGLSKGAFNSFGQVIDRDANSESIRVEAMINQVVTEVTRNDQPRDMHWCIDHWTQSINDSIVLRSEQWFNEAVQAHVAMCAAWPGEQEIKKLRKLIKHW